jgi:hypothetical protein
MTLQLLHSEFPYIWGKISFLFYQCTVHLRIGLDADPDVLATALHLAHSIGYTLNIAIGKKVKEVRLTYYLFTLQ